MLDPERWRRLEELYQAALPLSADERRTLLARECGGDDALRRDAESLLRAHDVRDDFLQDDAFELGLNVLAGDDEMNPGEDGPSFEANLDPERVIDGRYVILEALDAGGMGEVYKAKDLKFPGRPVVIKVLKRVSKQNPWKFKKFSREGEAQSRVRHNNVAVVFDSGTLPGGAPYLVVEFVDGRTLSDLISDHKAEDRQMELPLVAEIMRQTCAGVAAIHKASLIHRDLKPMNIMVCEPGAADDAPVLVKIIDFGIARDLEKSTEVGLSVGTLSYMSPEQVKGIEVTPASDVFSLGVLAYNLLTNNLPFNAKTHLKLDAAQAGGVQVKPSSLRPDLPPVADAVILKALAYDPARRYQSVREFRDELISALTEEATVPAPPRKIVDEVDKVKNRRSLWAAVTAVLTLVVAAAVIGIWWPRGGAAPTRAQKVAVVLEKDGPQAPYQREPGYPVGPPPQGAGYAMVGFNVWRVRYATPPDAADTEAARETVEDGEIVAERIDDGDYMRVGDRFKLSVESLTEDLLPDRGGYLYIVNREQYADGSFGRALLLFPNAATFNGENLIKTDQPVELPRPPMRAYRIKRGSNRPDYVAETYTIIVSPWKFWLPPLNTVEGQTEIPTQLFEEWERKFGGRSPRASLRDGVGKLRTRREQRVGTRETVEADEPLTQSDPLPQTVLRAVVKKGSPAMVTVALKVRD